MNERQLPAVRRHRPRRAHRERRTHDDLRGGRGGCAAQSRGQRASRRRSPAASPPGRARARRSTRSPASASAARWTRPSSPRSRQAYAERGVAGAGRALDRRRSVDRGAAHAPRLRPDGLRERARARPRARARGGDRQGGRDPRQPGERVRPLARSRRDRLRLARQPGRRLARGVPARRDRERHARLHGGERLRALDRAARRRPGRRRKPQAARRRRPALRRGDGAGAAPARHSELAARGPAGAWRRRPARKSLS